MYQSLNPDRIVATAELLQRRVAERFPDSNLSRVCLELAAVAKNAAAMSAALARPNLWLRIAVGFLTVLIAVSVCGTLWSLDLRLVVSSVAELLQALEAAINDVIFVCVAIFFLWTAEMRLKRRRALRALHVLRSMAHIVDMHQLTKDPERVTGAGVDTLSSPSRPMTVFELIRYLDYCSEILAVISKIAALYVQRFNDPVVLAAVNEVETLTAGLSRKVWQKIIIMDRTLPPAKPLGRLSEIE
jgi:hypothetical protein